MKPNHITERNNLNTESTSTQLRKQKRIRITSYKEKLTKRNVNKNLQCLPTQEPIHENITPICYINKKKFPHVVSVEVMRVVKIFQTVKKGINIERNIVNIL